MQAMVFGHERRKAGWKSKKARAPGAPLPAASRQERYDRTYKPTPTLQRNSIAVAKRYNWFAMLTASWTITTTVYV